MIDSPIRRKREDSNPYAIWAVGTVETYELECNIDETATICEEMYFAPWLENCRLLVDPTTHIQSCQIDLCIATSDDMKYTLLEIFVRECMQAEL